MAVQNITEEIVTWLKSLKGWQTELAHRVLTKQPLGSDDYKELIDMLKTEASFVDKPFPNLSGVLSANEHIRLKAIEQVVNIEKLSSRSPLVFQPDANVIVVYGDNGTGKSGYTRILKKVCGKPNSKSLKKNVFKALTSPAQCSIKYEAEGTDYEQLWPINGAPINDLLGVDIFDTDVGISYIHEERSAAYTPLSVALLEGMSQYYNAISTILQQEQIALISKLPSLPAGCSNTNAARLYSNLKVSHTDENLSYISWSEEKQKNLDFLIERLAQKDPKIAAQEKRKYSSEAKQIVAELEKASLKISLPAFHEIKELRHTATEKRRITQESTAVFQNQVKLDGVGSHTWNALWEAAKNYSISEAYKEKTFPNIVDSRCVFCQQPLSVEAQDRLLAFNKYVEGTLEAEAKQAESLVANRIAELPNALAAEMIITKCNAAGLDEHWQAQLKDVWNSISQVSEQITSGNKEVTDITEVVKTAISALNAYIKKQENEAAQHDLDQDSFDRDKTEKEKVELEAVKWCSEQREAILEEVERLKKLSTYANWIAQTSTTPVSRMASSVSEKVITQDYVARFNAELKKLGAHKIQVELVKQRTSKAIVYHSIKLKGVSHPPSEILSEGEFRIISLAAFLADVTGGNSCNPFIFDDPISSLDQKYEEKTIERLVKISDKRQVIIFTHRLSMLGQITDYCKKENIAQQTIGIRVEPWGAGEVGITPLFANKPINALNQLKNDRLAKAKKIYEQDGSDEYYVHGKSLCSDLRILIERIVEIVFFNDVIQRYRRSINTLNKIDGVAKISKQDCELIDRYMTKYSFFEHSQPDESPVDIPEPTEIESDINELINWHTEFSQRAIA